MNKNLTTIIRSATIAPIMAFVMLLILFITAPENFIETRDLNIAIFCLTILPISAYPLQKVIPKYKNKGRYGQRQLAIIMGILGYILGTVYSIVFGYSEKIFVIYLTYLFSGFLIFLFSKVSKVKASGHACGVAGPISILVYFLGAEFLIGLVLATVITG